MRFYSILFLVCAYLPINVHASTQVYCNFKADFLNTSEKIVFNDLDQRCETVDKIAVLNKTDKAVKFFIADTLVENKPSNVERLGDFALSVCNHSTNEPLSLIFSLWNGHTPGIDINVQSSLNQRAKVVELRSQTPFLVFGMQTKNLLVECERF